MAVAAFKVQKGYFRVAQMSGLVDGELKVLMVVGGDGTTAL